MANRTGSCFCGRERKSPLLAKPARSGAPDNRGQNPHPVAQPATRVGHPPAFLGLLVSGSAQDLDLHRLQVHSYYVEGADSYRAVDFLHGYGSLLGYADRLRRLRGVLIAVQHFENIFLGTEHDFDDDIELLCLREVCIGGDYYLLIIQNA